MNKEEIFNEISSCFKMSVDMNGMKKIEEYITNLQQQNQKYKEVIDKAIEYVENNSNIYLNIMGNKVGFFNEHNDGHVPIEILDILKEVK